MTFPFPSKSRPGIIAWIGFGLLVLFALWIIKIAFVTAFVEKATRTGGLTMMQGTTDGFYGYAEEKSVPPIAPDMRKIGGSAALDLDGQPTAQRVIKTGELTLRVENAANAMEDVRLRVTTKKGFVESSTISDEGEGPRTGWMTIRIPVTSFDEMMRDLKGIATLVLRETTGGQDVTMEFVDIEANLRNAKAEEASYLEILKRSGDIEDVLAVTQQLANVRGRIEQIEGRKRYMENQTDLATITVTLTEETRVEVPGRTWRPGEVIRQALRDLVESLQELVNFLIRLVIGIIGLLLPIAALTALLIWIGWKIVRALLSRFRK